MAEPPWGRGFGQSCAVPAGGLPRLASLLPLGQAESRGSPVHAALLLRAAEQTARRQGPLGGQGLQQGSGDAGRPSRGLPGEGGGEATAGPHHHHQTCSNWTNQTSGHQDRGNEILKGAGEGAAAGEQHGCCSPRHSWCGTPGPSACPRRRAEGRGATGPAPPAHGG